MKQGEAGWSSYLNHPPTRHGTSHSVVEVIFVIVEVVIFVMVEVVIFEIVVVVVALVVVLVMEMTTRK